MSTYVGVDYSLGLSNVNQETGIHYGVIPMDDVSQAWCDSAKANYGDPTCPQCGADVGDMPDRWHKRYPKTYTEKGIDKVCRVCKTTFDCADCYNENPISHDLDDGEYKASQGGDDRDIFIIVSPYYTRAQFCSPCAPGAGHLRNPTPNGPKTYCLNADWFDSEYPCPYPIYRVDNNECIYTPKGESK